MVNLVTINEQTECSRSDEEQEIEKSVDYAFELMKKKYEPDGIVLSDLGSDIDYHEEIVAHYGKYD